MNSLIYTTTGYTDEDVYQYDVYWVKRSLGDDKWSHKPFARKQDAKEFAKRHKSKHIFPKPYIIQTIVARSTFSADASVEHIKKDFKSIYAKYNYCKIIKY